MKLTALAIAALAVPALAQVSYPPADLSQYATNSSVASAVAAAPFVKSVQSIGPDASGNVAGIATSSMLSSVVIAGDVIQVVNPSAGATITPSTGVTVALINNTTLLTALTVNMPSNPADGQRFTISSAAGVTVLTLSGATVKGTLSTLAVSGYARFIYSANAGYWFRTG